MDAVDNRALAPHYYRDNFLILCDTVEEQYADLLDVSEQAFLDRFRALDFDAQCLYVRLVSRVGPWFRESKLAYEELGDTPPIVDRLLESGMAEQAPGLAPEDLGRLFTRAELLAAFETRLGGPSPRGKPALLAAIADLALADEEYLQALSSLDPARVVAPCAVEQVQLLQLLFFGNRHQSLTDFVLSDLGLARYYPYPLDRQHRLFANREALEEYLLCAGLADTWYELRETGEVEGLLELGAAILATDIAYPSSEGRWHRLCNGLARDLERQGELAAALPLYRCSQRHPARERRLRILERSGEWEPALALGEEILASPWCEEERDAAARVLPRVRRQLGQKVRPRRRDAFQRLDLVLPQQSRPVELIAADRLQSHWRAVHYVENTLMNALFGLAFWEQIFTPVPGVFHNPYQSVPTDMYGPEFRRRRLALLEARLQELQRGDVAALLLEAYHSYAAYQCRWVDWRRLDPVLLQQVTGVVPADHLLAVWRRMLFDPRENRRGFPDLIALGESVGDYCLIEVKGPGDALQESQKRWLRFFGQQGIPARVAWVSWEGAGD